MRYALAFVMAANFTAALFAASLVKCALEDMTMPVKRRKQWGAALALTVVAFFACGFIAAVAIGQG